MILSLLISISISVALVIWLNWCKKRSTGPFGKHMLAKLLVFGGLSGVISATISLVLGCVKLIVALGPQNIFNLMNDFDVEKAQQLANLLREHTGDWTFPSAFLGTFLLVGLVEEGCRFIGVRLMSRRRSEFSTVLDMVICGGLFGCGFQIYEDISYSLGSGLIVALARALTPFHYLFGAIMGYFIGKALVTGKKSYYAWALMAPALIHTLFDTSISALEHENDFIILAAILAVLLIALVIVSIVKITRASKDQSLSQRIPERP